MDGWIIMKMGRVKKDERVGGVASLWSTVR